MFLEDVKPRPNEESRTYTVTAKPWILDRLEAILATIQYLGQVGASRELRFGVDGDGPARMRIERDGSRIKLPDEAGLNLDKDPLQIKGIC